MLTCIKPTSFEIQHQSMMTSCSPCPLNIILGTFSAGALMSTGMMGDRATPYINRAFSTSQSARYMNLISKRSIDECAFHSAGSSGHGRPAT